MNKKTKKLLRTLKNLEEGVNELNEKLLYLITGMITVTDNIGRNILSVSVLAEYQLEQIVKENPNLELVRENVDNVTSLEIREKQNASREESSTDQETNVSNGGTEREEHNTSETVGPEQTA